MSEMSLQVAVRFLVIDDASHLSKLERYELCKALFGNEGVYDDFDNYFEFPAKDNGGWTVNFPENKMFIDYIISDEHEAYDVDVMIPAHGSVGGDEESRSLAIIANEFTEKFVVPMPEEDVAKYKLIQTGIEYAVRVLYFYNGSSSGIFEVI